MPRIVNAYDGNSALGKTLADLGESIYGDQAQREVYRQKAFGQKNINDLATDGTVGLDDPRLAKAQLAIGGNASGTFAGQGRALANDRWTNAATNAAGERNNVRTNAETHYGTDRKYDSDIATTGMNNASAERVGAGNNATSIAVGTGNNDASRDVAQIQADKQAASDKYKFDNTYENTYDPDTNRTVLTPRSQAAGREVAPTKDSVVGGMLRKVADGQQASQPGAPLSNPFAALPPQVQHVAGVDVPEQSMIEPRSGMTGISRDGGQTLVLPNGATIPATGFQPVPQETALNQARDNNVRQSASKPLVVGNPINSQASADAANTTGIGSKAATFFNDDLGAIPGGPAVLNAVTGSPEIAPGIQRSRAQQDVRNNAARAVLLGGPGRQTVQAQKWVNDLIPQGDAFANPATEAAKIPTIVNALAGDHEQIRQLVIDPNTAPAERVKLVQQLHQIENTIRMYTDPPPAAPAQPAAPTAGAPAQAPTQTATNPKTGQKMGLVNGQWVPFSGTDAAPPRGGGDPLSQGRAAIAAGANPAAVKQRLHQNGIDPSGL